jgi:hypothetical protein
MYIRERSGWGQVPMVVYNRCNGGCTTASNWAELDVQAINRVGSSATTRFFVLDNQDKPHAVVDGPSEQLFYFTCQSGCDADAANWTYTSLPGIVGRDAAIAVDANRVPHVVYRGHDNGVSSDNDLITYVTCTQPCTDGNNWGGQQIFFTGAGFESVSSIDLTTTGAPRIAFYSGQLVSNNPDEDQRLVYAWCNSDCTTQPWDGYNLDLPKAVGLSPWLVLDAANRPHISYFGQATGSMLGYSRCTANCESVSASWDDQVVEETINYPAPPNPGCTTSFWYTTAPTSLALTAQGAPHIVFGTRNLQTCGGTVVEKLRLVRYVRAASNAPPGSPTPGSPIPGSPTPGTPPAVGSPTRLPPFTPTVYVRVPIVRR